MAINFRSRQIQAPPTTGQQPLPMRAAYQGASEAWEHVGNAAARAGYAVAEPLLEKAQIDASSKTANAKTEYETLLNNLKAARMKSNNPDGWEAELNAAHTGFLGDIKQKIPYRQFADGFTKWANLRKESERGQVAEQAELKRRDLRKADLTLNVHAAEQMGNKSLIETLYKTAAANNDMSSEEAMVQILNAKLRTDRNVAVAKMQTDPDSVHAELSGSDWQKLYPDLTEQARQELIRDARYWKNVKKAEAREALEEQRETDRDTLLDALNGQLKDEAGNPVIVDYDMIEKTSLDEHEKQNFWEAAQKLAAQQAKGAYEYTDPAIEAEMLRKIDLGQPITRQDIYSKVAKGLSTQTAKELSTRLSSREKSKKPDYPMTAQVLIKDLEKLYSSTHFASAVDERKKPIDPEDMTEQDRLFGASAFVALHKEFTGWLDENPTATDEQIRVKYQTLVTPTAEQIGFTFWEGLEWGSQDRQEKRNWKYWDSLIKKHDLNMSQVADQTASILGELGLDTEEPMFRMIDSSAEPTDMEEFVLTVASIQDEAKARTYYNQYIDRFKEE
jgi:hypothetical protein